MRDVSLIEILSHFHIDYDLYKLNEILTNLSKILTNYEMLVNVHDWARNIVNSLFTNELNYDSNEERRLRDEKHAQLNDDQRHCFDTIVTIVNNDADTTHFFIQRFANTSKIFLYQTLCHHFRARNEIVLCVAFSRIATLLLSNEQTFHFRFKISFQISKKTICNIIRNMRLYDLLRRTKLIIWDEVFMQHKHCFTNVHHTFTNLMNNEYFFDEISIVLSDDFVQILFVVQRNIRDVIVETNIQRCFL